MIIRLNIPLAAPSLNTWYSGNHWSKRNKYASDWHLAVMSECRRLKIKPVTKFPVKIVTIPYRKSKKKLDIDNLFTGNKLATDGLVKAGILPSDTPDIVVAQEVTSPVFGHTEDITAVLIYSGFKKEFI